VAFIVRVIVTSGARVVVCHADAGCGRLRSLSEVIAMSVPMQAPPQKKKGLPVLAWVAIGCGAILVLCGVAVVGTGWWAAHKLKNFAEKAKDNPNYIAQTAAEWAVKANPDLELVSSDDQAGTMTVKNKKTGETVTLSFDDIAKGKLSVESGGQKADISFEGGEQGGAMKVQTSQGTATFGAGGATQVPAWFPVYPGAASEGVGSVDMNGEHSGGFTLKTADPVDQVAAFYQEKLKGLGLSVSTVSMDIGGTPTTTISGQSEKRNVNVTVSRADNATSALVTYSDKP
jgi:hypothetical protein